MKIGIDYFKTITEAPDRYRDLAQALMDGGWEVYVASAVTEKEADKRLHDVQKINIPHTALSILIYNRSEEVPQLKLEYCIHHKLDIYIDDNLKTCELLRKNGILALQVISPD